MITDPWCRCDAPVEDPIYALHSFQCAVCQRALEHQPDWEQWWADVAAYVAAQPPVHTTAKYPGRCPECRKPIKPHDPIVFSETRKARHQECWT